MIIEHNGNKYTIHSNGTITCENAWGQVSMIAINWVGKGVVEQMVVNTLEEIITSEKSLQGKRYE